MSIVPYYSCGSSAIDTIGVRACFEGLEDFSRRAEQYNQRLRDAEKATEQYAKKVNESQKQASTATQNASVDQLKALRTLRWEIITVLFYFRMIGTVAKAAWDSVSASYQSHLDLVSSQALASAYQDSVGDIVASLDRVTEGSLGTAQSVKVALTGLVATQGQFTDQYADLWQAAEVISTITGGEVIDIFGKLASAISDGSAKAAESVAPFYDLTGAVEKYAEAQGKTADELSLAERQNALMNSVLDDTQIMLENGANVAVDYARGVQELEGAWKDLTNVFFASIGVTEGAGGVLDFLAQRLETVSQLVTIAGAKFAGFFAYVKSILSQLVLPESFADFLWMGDEIVASIKNIDTEAARAASVEAFRARFNQATEAMGKFEDSTNQSARTLERFGDTSRRVTEQDLGGAINHLLKYQDIVEQHNKRLADIESRYNEDVIDAQDKYYEKLQDAEDRYNKARQDALDKYNKRVAKQIRDDQDDEAKRLAQHLQRLQFAEEDYQLRRVQNEREYQYERELLVARGDVLGIEDLDARHQLQQQSDEENYNLRIKQMQEAYDLQQAYERKALDDQINYLKENLQDQLQEIEDQYRERLADAQKAYDEEMADAAENRRKLLDEEAADFAEQRKQWAEHWAEIVRQTNLSTDQIFQILQGYFGQGATLDEMMSAFMARRELEVQIIAQMLASVNGAVSGWTDEALANFTSTQRLINMAPTPTSGAGASPYMGSYGTPYGPQMSAGAQPGLSTYGQVSMVWGGGSIPVTMTNPATGVVQAANVDDNVIMQILEMITQSLRMLRSH